jgi:sigma-B regulation protein RsbU (phosphoserine phosphatase)
MTSSEAQKLHPLLEALLPTLRYVAQIWQSKGADGIVLYEGQQPLLTVPQDLMIDSQRPCLKSPIRHEQMILVLAVQGIDDSSLQNRLFTDSQLIQATLQREQEIAYLTDELVTIHDQRIAQYELNYSLREHTEISDVLGKIVQQVQSIIDVAGIAIGLQPTQTLKTPPRFTVNGIQPLEQSQLSQLFQEAQSLPEYLILTDIHADYDILLVPLHLENGAGWVAFVNNTDTFSMPLIKLATALTEQAYIHIHKTLLFAEIVEKKHVEAEIEVAHRVQMSLLPRTPIETSSIDMWMACLPARQVGGDFYDVRQLSDDKITLSLGDVAGKGISAALLMAISLTTLRVLNQASPAQMLKLFSDTLYDDFNRVDSFVTLFTAQYDLHEHTLRYANAGHSPVIFCNAKGEARMLEADAPPIGVLPDCMVGESIQQFALNDIVVITSDGIPEADTEHGAMLGYEALTQIIHDNRHCSAKEIGKTIMASIANQDTSHDDDRTVVILKRVGSIS